MMKSTELKQSKKANIDSKLVQLVDTLPHGVQECNLQGEITFSNKAHHQLLGFNMGELIGRHVWDFQVNEIKKQEVQDYLCYLIAKQPPPTPYVTTYISCDGHHKIVEINWNYLRNDAKELTGFVSIISDITEFIRSEKALINNQVLLEEAQSISHLGHWELNPTTMEAVWSKEIFNILGLKVTSEAGQEVLSKLLHPDDKERVLSSLQCAISNGSKHEHHMEYRIIRPDKDIRWVECKAMKIWNNKGELHKLRGIFQDISERKKIENKHFETLTTLKNLINSTPDLIFVKNNQLQTILCNKAYAKAVGKTCEQMYGHTDIENGWKSELVNGNLKKGIRGFKHDDRDVLSGMTVSNRYDPANIDGKLRIFDTIKLPLKDTNDNITGVLGISRDITERKQSEDKLKLLSNVFIHASEGILITDTQGHILDVNEAFTHITGYSRKEVLGKNPKLLQSGLHDKKFYDAMWQEVNGRGYWYGEIWNRRKNGDIYAEKLNINAVKDADNIPLNYIAIFSDITSIKKHQEHLEHIAHYDLLTNLPNRVLLSNHLERAMAQTNRQADHLTIAYLDLDGFKEVNDTYGHALGDKLLVTLTNRLKKHLRKDDIFARIGGDEFVVVLSSLSKEHDCIPLIKRLLTAASNPILIENNILHVSTSIGMTFFPQAEKIDADQLLRQADQAMYLAKQSGKNCYKIFDMSQDRFVRQRHESIDRIQLALENNEFIMFYQPKVNMNSGEILGAEALIRWQHPEKGLLPPIEFLPLIEDDFISVKIGDWVISNTLEQLNQWHKSGLKLTISINISALHLQQPNFVKNLKNKLNKYPDIGNHYLELEILETSALDDVNHVSEIMELCRKFGVHFALDDFGTGYSSLTYLKRLPANTLKIDQTFIRDMMNNSDDLAIIEGIIGLSSAFKRLPIAEGVETIEHGTLLLKLGCDYAQGYAIAKPMPAHEIDSWIDNWRHPSPWKNTKRFNRDEISLLYAFVEQKIWVKALKLYIKGKTTIPPELDIDKCRFGIWLKKTGKEKYGHLSIYTKINKKHKKLHNIAKNILIYKDKSDKNKLLNELSSLKKTSTDLLLMFDKLLKS
jgi:diguanylate cyclase (GGDEF)-like protein/PAS domain S-box-containing protein